MSEIWKYVPDKDGVMASSLGRIVKQPSYAPVHNGGFRSYLPSPTYGYVTKANKNAKHEYRGVYFKGIGNLKVHQAVCAAFHGPKPFPKAVVIHLDEDAHNNSPENLKWGTQKENLNMPKFIAQASARRGDKSNAAVHRRNNEAVANN